MTIKQQGGIFGRNPAFNDVDANSLDVDGSITATGLTVDGNIATTGGSTNNRGLLLSHQNNINASFISRSENGAADTGNRLLFDFDNDSFQVNTGGATRLDISNTGNVNVKTGNLVIGTSGNGIDFSATSGTGTSELFSDYEEGSFSPTLTTDGTDFSSVSYDSRRGGSYTKIGRMVHIQLTMITDSITVGSASGNVVIGGLPFPPTTTAGGGTDQGYAALSVANGSNWTSNPPTAARVHETGSYIQLMIGATLTAIADANTGSNDNYVNISGTYITD